MSPDEPVTATFMPSRRLQAELGLERALFQPGPHRGEVPCRVGTVRQEETLRRLIAGHPLGAVSAELQLLREMGQAMRDASICGLGQTASSALESALNRWSLFL